MAELHPTHVEMIGFDADESLNDLLVKFRVLPDYKAFLPEHLTEVLRKQHPNAVLRQIRLLRNQPGCRLGGIQNEDGKLITVQDLDVSLDLEVLVAVDNTTMRLNIQLVIRATGLDNVPQVVTDMHVRRQEQIE